MFQLYFIEKLTADIEEKAWELIGTIDAMGGSVNAIDEGFMQNEIAESAYRYQQAIESKDKIIVGVNSFFSDNEISPPSFKIDDSIRQVQMNKLKALKEKRDHLKVEDSLKKIKEYAAKNENLMPVVIDAVECFCTLGEIADALREIFGEYK